MDASEDAASCIQTNEVIEPLQHSDCQDRKKSFLASRSKEGNSDSVSSNTVKKVRFSDQVDYCDFYTDTIGNSIHTLSEDHLNEIPSEMEELSSEIMSLNISSILEEKETSEEVSPTSSIINAFDLIENFDSAECKDQKVVLQENEENCSISVQRIGNLFKPKQTKRLNDLLKKDLNNSKAKDFKTAVYRAWTAVKKETKENFPENLPTFASSKLEDEHAQKSVRLAYVLWKKSKDKELKYAKKVGEKKLLSSNVTQEFVRSDKEDNEIAFLSWKKRKDEILKQEAYNKIQNERNAAEITLMNEEEKRKDGESAFLAWKAHKAHVSREEKKKMTFYKEKEQQAIEEKETRNMQALYMYNLWVKSKSYAKQRKWSKQTMKPPWYPPGNKCTLVFFLH